MDADHFDTVTRSLIAGSSRRRLMATIVALGLSTLGTRGEPVETAAKKKRKKHKKKRQTCRPVCGGKTCGDDGCGGSCGACGSGLACQAGSCVCVPDAQATTCAGQCGTKTNNCGQSVTCPCGGSKQCLSNGSCAGVCSGSIACPSGCLCSLSNTEGQTHCVIEATCPEIVQDCMGTAQCPMGHHCQPTGCAITPKCVPLCPQ
jgi:hypothetical protein